MLLEQGHEVTGLDTYWFGLDGIMDLMSNPRFTRIEADIRTFDMDILKGMDCVMDLASISNDQTSELYPDMTMEINWKGRLRMATLAKRMKVPRYILASSAAVYGANDEIVNEDFMPYPLTTYAKAMLKAERDIRPLSDDNFCVTILRQANVYGLSKKMRLDLAVNGMTLGLFKDGKLNILRDGSQWRPFIHIKDTSRTFIKVMEAKESEVNGEVFNVGSDEQNYQIINLAHEVCSALELPEYLDWYGEKDNRNYRVNFRKIREALGFKPEFTPRDGAKEVFAALKDKTLDPTDPRWTIKSWYEVLGETFKLSPVEIRRY